MDQLPIELMLMILEHGPPSKLLQVNKKFRALPIPRLHVPILFRSALRRWKKKSNLCVSNDASNGYASNAVEMLGGSCWQPSLQLALQLDPVERLCVSYINDSQHIPLSWFGEQALQMAIKHNAREWVQLLWSRKDEMERDLGPEGIFNWLGSSGAIYALLFHYYDIIEYLFQHHFFTLPEYAVTFFHVVSSEHDIPTPYGRSLWHTYWKFILDGCSDGIYLTAGVLSEDLNVVKKLIDNASRETVPLSPIALWFAVDQGKLEMAQLVFGSGMLLESDMWIQCAQSAVMRVDKAWVTWIVEVMPPLIRRDCVPYILQHATGEMATLFVKGLTDADLQGPLIWAAGHDPPFVGTVCAVLMDAGMNWSDEVLWRILASALTFFQYESYFGNFLIANTIYHICKGRSLDWIQLANFEYTSALPVESEVAFFSWLRRVSWLQTKKFPVSDNVDQALLLLLSGKCRLASVAFLPHYFPLILALGPSKGNPSILKVALVNHAPVAILEELLEHGFHVSKEFLYLLKTSYKPLYKSLSRNDTIRGVIKRKSPLSCFKFS